MAKEEKTRLGNAKLLYRRRKIGQNTSKNTSKWQNIRQQRTKDVIDKTKGRKIWKNKRSKGEPDKKCQNIGKNNAETKPKSK